MKGDVISCDLEWEPGPPNWTFGLYVALLVSIALHAAGRADSFLGWLGNFLIEGGSYAMFVWAIAAVAPRVSWAVARRFGR